MPVEIFAKTMSKLMATQSGYIITFTPNAAKIKIGPGKYDAQKTWIEVVQDVLERNSGNLKYIIDSNNRYIHIYTINESHKKNSHLSIHAKRGPSTPDKGTLRV